MKTVTYGTVRVPFLATRTLLQLSRDDEKNFPLAAPVLRENFYMDNVLCGAASLMEAKALKNQLSGILKKAGMELHKWGCSHPELASNIIEEAKEWHRFLEDFNSESSICIGRCIVHPQATKAELHSFADASEKCYGTVIYCHSQSPHEATTVKLVTSKSRVAPVKSVTMPRLELCATVLLAKLMKRVETALQMKTPPVYLWSDSTIVLAWIQKEPNLLKTFVANRVATIQQLTNAEQWHHVSSEQNPADLVSRGLDPSSLHNNSVWWNGPTFLTSKDFPERNILSSVTDSDEFNCPQVLLYQVRQRFWPLRGRNVCRKIVHDCLVCFKVKQITCEQIMGNLPKERVRENFPFDCSGIDFIGPFSIKSNKQRKSSLYKTYVSIFVCFVTKAVHFELVSDLTIQAFIASLKRFIARRERPSLIFSDNGKTFIGANAELERLYKLVCEGPSGPHFENKNNFESQKNQ
ncbi:integrase catalytic domain-containing protein [Trichonephila clavipes]|nr:integrase catalytic domain-containing protein [Trichonephila clavipes]